MRKVSDLSSLLNIRSHYLLSNILSITEPITVYCDNNFSFGSYKVLKSAANLEKEIF